MQEGYFFFRCNPSLGESTGTVFKTEAVVKVGTIQPGNGDDYNHLLLAKQDYRNYLIYDKLDQFVGKS